MFKAALIGFALFFNSEALNLQHEVNIDIEKLSDIQTKALDFMKSKVPNLKDTLLTKGTQDNDVFKYQFLGKDTPIRMTEVEAKRVKDDKNKDKVAFKLNEVIQAFTGPTENGRLTSQKTVFDAPNFEEAVKKLKWN